VSLKLRVSGFEADLVEAHALHVWHLHRRVLRLCWGLRFRVKGSGFRAPKFRVYGSVFRVYGSGFRV
jgi:hypothetical protein